MRPSRTMIVMSGNTVSEVIDTTLDRVIARPPRCAAPRSPGGVNATASMPVQQATKIGVIGTTSWYDGVAGHSLRTTAGFGFGVSPSHDHAAADVARAANPRRAAEARHVVVRRPGDFRR